MILGEVYIGEMIMNNDYKNIIELKDGVDKDLSKEIKNICLEIYNKGEQLVKLVNIDDKRFELVTDEKGKNNLLIGVGLVQRNKIVLDNMKSWYWEEPNKFECGDILGFIRELEEKEKVNKWAV